MSYKSDGSFIARKGTAAPSVTQYATVAELITASQGGLAPGYYEVVGEWITYWDGAVFAPEYSPIAPTPLVYNLASVFNGFGTAIETHPTVLPAGDPDYSTSGTWVLV